LETPKFRDSYWESVIPGSGFDFGTREYRVPVSSPLVTDRHDYGIYRTSMESCGD